MKRTEKKAKQFHNIMNQLSDETFCVKKCQFRLLKRPDEFSSFYHLDMGRRGHSSIKLCINEWLMFEETKDCYWFRRK